MAADDNIIPDRSYEISNPQLSEGRVDHDTHALTNQSVWKGILKSASILEEPSPCWTLTHSPVVATSRDHAAHAISLLKRDR